MPKICAKVKKITNGYKTVKNGYNIPNQKIDDAAAGVAPPPARNPAPPLIFIISLIYCAAVFSPVEQPDREIQIARESDPEQIGELQPAGERIDLAKEQQHTQDQPPERDQPEERRAEGLQVEKDQRPAEVEKELQPVDAQAGAPGGGRQGKTRG